MFWLAFLLARKAKIAGFTITTCNGADAPADGCTDFWGNKVDPKNCWFGRGATQLTWPGNYQGLEAIVQKAPSSIGREVPSFFGGAVGLLECVREMVFDFFSDGV